MALRRPTEPQTDVSPIERGSPRSLTAVHFRLAVKKSAAPWAVRFLNARSSSGSFLKPGGVIS